MRCQVRFRLLQGCHLYLWCVTMSPVVCAAFWSLVWFLGFCILANQWQVSKQEDNPLNEGADAARAAIVFSFFSVFAWVRTT